MRSNKTGFTIVELLIVIIVIGVLSMTVLVAYAGAQNKARNAIAVREGTAWRDLLVAYRVTYGTFPLIPNNYYCLGSGFPKGVGGVPRCRDYNGVNNVLESDNAALMTELAKIGSLPSGERKGIDGSIGPFVWFDQNITADVIIVLRGSSGSECPAPWKLWWTDNSTRVFCSYRIEPI